MILRFLDLAGVAVFAISGALTAGRKQLDLIGVFVVASLAAIGGGTLRDLLLDRHPIFWIRDSTYLFVIAGATAGTILYARVLGAPPAATLLVADALGLGFFTIGGAQIAEQRALPWLSIVLMGTMTGAAGGVLRDVICNEVPLIMRRGELYATACIVGTGAYIALRDAGVAAPIAAYGGMALVIALRLAAIFFKLRLPVFVVHDDADDR